MDRDRELHDMADEGRALMSDYIKRIDALDIVAYNNVHGEITLNRYCKIIDGIYEIPSADAAPVRHGHWIEKAFRIMCSDCGAEFKDEILYMIGNDEQMSYCPNCGARMDGGIDSEKSDEDV